MGELPAEVSALIAARSAAVVRAAVSDFRSVTPDQLAHVLHRHAGTMATFGIPLAERVMGLDAALAAGMSESDVLAKLAELTRQLEESLDSD